jgi:hypothetical protein
MSTIVTNEIRGVNDVGVLTPTRPAFRAEKRASNQSLSDGVTTTITFEHTVFNIGSNYNTSTSQFTAPLAGIYHFNSLTRAVANSGTMDYFIMFLYKNGSLHSDMLQMQTSANNMLNSHLGGSVTVQLAVDDYVEIRVQISGTSPLVHSHASGERTWFSGFLVG